MLFVFDNDMMQSLTAELKDIDWQEGFRLIEFDNLSWFGVKYAIEHEWKDDKIILVFHGLSPANPTDMSNFPLAGLLAANAEYRNEGYEQFMQHHDIPDRYATLVKNHIDEFDRERFAKLLRPYFSSTEFAEDPVMRGLICGYMGEGKILSWEEIILKLIVWDVFPEHKKKEDQFYLALSNNPDVKNFFDQKIAEYFNLTINPLKADGKWKEFVDAMKYNSITQLLPPNPSDSYVRLKVSDSLRLEKLNRLIEASRFLPKQLREQFNSAYDKLSADIHEDSILSTYGIDANYYTISSAMADAMIASIARDLITSDPTKAISQILNLKTKIDETSMSCNALDYMLDVSSFYEKLSRLGSVVFNSPDEYIAQYTNDLYLFDLYYRKSIQKYHLIDSSLDSFPALESLKHNLDKDYARIANKINSEWTKCLKEKGNGYAEITKCVFQQNFFRDIYDPSIKQAIIICDAFRYELAKELVERIAKDGKRFVSELSPGIAMLPTETKYCKSALLPHTELNLIDLTLSVDNKILDDTQSKEAHLAEYIPGAKVVDFQTVLHGSREVVRPLFTGNPLTVLFFDDVDHEGHGNNPRKVVNTCAEAIEDLAKVIAKIHDDGNIYHVYLTSDHGFLYNDMVFEDKDKLDINDDYLEKRSRYYLTRSCDEINGIVKFPLPDVSAFHADIYVAVPDGTNRIMARSRDYNFTHGGASLQEVVIPILHTYSPRLNKKTPTGVSLLGHNLSIVSSRLKVQLFQENAVSDSIKERTVRCAIYSGECIISNEKLLTLSSTNADNAAARIFDVDLTLLQSGSGLLQLRVYDIADNLNPLIKATVTDNTLIERDEF